MFDSFKIYTDGSCHPQSKTGAWAAILLYDNKKITIQGTATNTTHNRMELLAVLKAIEFVFEKFPEQQNIDLFSDSQYVVYLLDRKGKLVATDFKTKKGVSVRNIDLLKQFFQYLEKINVGFTKVKAHQRKTPEKNYNREVDRRVRQILRAEVKSRGGAI